MDVRLPDGSVIRGVPDGTTRAQLAEKLSANGYQVPQEWMPKESVQPEVTAMDRAGAVASGFNAGVAGLAGIPVDTMANIRDIGKAAAGSVIGLFSKEDGTPILNKEGKPAYYDVGENGELIPAATLPVARIPDALQIGDRSQDFGSGAHIQAQLNKLPGRPADIPRPDDEASRYLFAAGASLPMAATGPKTGVPLTPSVAANVVGSQAAQVAAENDVGPAGQVLAGAVAGGVTAAARPVLAETTKRAFRGGEEGRQKTAQNIADFEASGASASAGAATQSRRVQAVESFLSKLPGSAGRMAAKGEQLAKDLGGTIEKMAAQLASKASGEQAGRTITRGVSGEDGFVSKFKAKQESLYNELDKHIAQESRVDVTNTAKALKELNADIPGAPNVSEFFKNSTIKGIEGALKADTEGASGLIARPDVPEFSSPAAKGQKQTSADPFRATPNKDPFGPATKDDLDLAADLLNDGKLPYEALKKLRTLVGREMADTGLASSVPRSKWKALYGALSSDLEAAAGAAGPQATSAFNRANNFTRAGMKRIEVLDSVIDKNGGPEAVFRAATSGAKEGATTLRAVMQSLPQEARKVLSASVLRRLGRATAGKQDSLGEAFSTETFLTNWNTLSPQAKGVLFDRFGPAFRQDMDAVARVASNLRSGSKVFQNPSGTAQAGLGAATAGAFALSVLQGNVGTAAAIGSGVATANLASRLMTYPRFVKWLAKTTNLPPKALPALLIQLEQGSDDEREFAQLVRERLKATTRSATPARQ